MSSALLQSSLSTLDHLIGRALFVDTRQRQPPGEKAAQRAERAFGFSLAVSATRCIIQYVLLPFVLPVLGVAADVAAHLSIAISLVAVVSIVLSLRRFWQINYKYKWQYLVMAAVMFMILAVFIQTDLQAA